MIGFDLVRFRNAMCEGVVNFVYLKSDGSLRSAKGTTNFDFIPADKQPTGRGVESPDHILKYWDVDRDGWRSLNTAKLLWTMQQGLVPENVEAIKYGGDLEQDVMDLASRIVQDYEAKDREDNGPTLFDD